MFDLKYKTQKQAFTLVELIVVIVILAILATIAFLSFGSQSSSARDSTRLSDIASISKGLMVYQSTKSTYPNPDKLVKIWYGSKELGAQGEIGSSVKSNIKAGADGFVDPLDKTNYTYAINKNGTKYKIGTYLENKDSVSLLYPKITDDNIASAATSYTNRFLFLKGDSVAILYTLTGSVETPIQDYAETNSLTGIDLKSSTNTASGIMALSDNNTGGETIDEGTVATYINSVQWRDIAGTSCDKDDFSFTSNGVLQTWAGCNSVLGEGSEYSKADGCLCKT